uniref:Probable arginine--tRNA ligase, mitochondrial n=2 Tax=Meloidogyne incognita group TaxID=654580 RepID=A0A915MET2_MELJA
MARNEEGSDYIFLLIVATFMVATGSLNTLSAKWVDQLAFDHPVFQTICMFFGEFCCLIVYLIMHFIRKRQWKMRNQFHEGGAVFDLDLEDEPKLPRFNPFIFLPPACCDMLGTSIMYVGLNLTTASSFQMLRGSVIIFTGLLSTAFLRARLRGFKWLGMGLVALGLLVVGLSDIEFDTNPNDDLNAIITGNLLIVIAQIVKFIFYDSVAIQMVSEQKFVLEYDVPPLLAVGLEEMLAQSLHRVAFSSNLIPEMLAKFGTKSKKLVVDFSSPNIAKTFHMGNLRSTLYGNFIQKICRLAGHEVVSINYLGDWGPQFSMLAFYWLAVMDGKEGRIKRPEPEEWIEMNEKKKVELLTSSYAATHRMSKLNASFSAKSRQLFLEMEKIKINGAGNEQNISSSQAFEALNLLKEWREISCTYLKDLYSRFGVNFDVWDGESNYILKGSKLVDEMIFEGKCVRFPAEDECWGVVNLDPGLSKIPLRRIDGANLYLNRELASIYDRQNKYNADKYIYVVDKSQANHFAHLRALLKMRGDSDLAEKIIHHSYGKVIGLSTREGKNDSVDYLISEGNSESDAYIKKSYTRKSSEEEREFLCQLLTQNQLAFSIICRAKHSDFNFSFKGAFLPEGTNSLILLEKYSRLNSLEKANLEHLEKLKNLSEVDLMKMQPEIGENGRKLARMILEFDTVLNNSLQKMEPSPIAIHLVRLSNKIGQTLPSLRILGEP